MFALSIGASGCIENGACLFRVNECLNGGECIDGDCECPVGYAGEDCQDFYPCAVTVCENGGICDEQDGSCWCEDGYEGEFCQLEEREKFIGTYTTTGDFWCLGEADTTALTPKPLTIDVAITSITAVIVRYDGLSIPGTVQDDEIFMPNINLGGIGYNYSGRVYYTEDSLRVSIHRSLFDQCNYRLTAFP